MFLSLGEKQWEQCLNIATKFLTQTECLFVLYITHFTTLSCFIQDYNKKCWIWEPPSFFLEILPALWHKREKCTNQQLTHTLVSTCANHWVTNNLSLQLHTCARCKKNRAEENKRRQSHWSLSHCNGFGIVSNRRFRDTGPFWKAWLRLNQRDWLFRWII